ncbi:DUF6457 domain-containing protein [Paenarthrobacter sp. PH39-S1]|uniref:DUF6457 domain-containing protein n=1 Tax=Micrococcaceae TaxID=1268 RepID=UPI0024BB053E|nr:DUF6457 domain-containing protein [Paenarthrobacter sp. PH39-S1]MDJ0354613.1 DUF6457 domain-containing protein [Paenarthrobacter sp. PH39-S1]
MKSQEEVLEDWVHTLLQAFEIADLTIDTNAVLKVAGEAAHAVVRPAAPLTTFIAGLAAGLAAGSGQAAEAAAMRAALELAGNLAVAEAGGED